MTKVHVEVFERAEDNVRDSVETRRLTQILGTHVRCGCPLAIPAGPGSSLVWVRSDGLGAGQSQ